MYTVSGYLEGLDRDNLFIFMGAGINPGSYIEKTAVLFSHELSRTGAPYVLLNLAEVFIKNNYCVVVVAQSEDDLLTEFTDAGANVIIYPGYLEDSGWLKSITCLPGIIFANTLICAPVVKKMQSIEKHVFWWIHENELIFRYYKRLYGNICIDRNITLLSAGQYVQGMVKKYMGRNSYIFNFGIEDARDTAGSSFKYMDKTGRCIRFMQTGTFDGLKGQEVLAGAINILDSITLNKCDFTFCGNISNANIEILQIVKTLEEKYPNVHIIPPKKQADLYLLFQSVDIFIVPSIIEPTSAVMAEALMMGKPGICSDVCGICRHLTDGKDAYIFKSQDSADLAEKIKYVTDNLDQLAEVGRNARRVYEAVYSMEIFEKNLFSLLESRNF